MMMNKGEVPYSAGIDTDARWRGVIVIPRKDGFFYSIKLIFGTVLIKINISYQISLTSNSSIHITMKENMVE